MISLIFPVFFFSIKNLGIKSHSRSVYLLRKANLAYGAESCFKKTLSPKSGEFMI